jgi:hypothetical protein
MMIEETDLLPPSVGSYVPVVVTGQSYLCIWSDEAGEV